MRCNIIMNYDMVQYIIIAGAEADKAMKKAEKEMLAYREAAKEGFGSRGHEGSAGSHGTKHMGDHYQPTNNTLSRYWCTIALYQTCCPKARCMASSRGP